MIDLTVEELNNATDYIPIMEKTQIATYVGERCFLRVEITTDGGNRLPPMYREDKNKSSRYLMGLLAMKYLHMKFTPVEGEEYLMSADDYDRFMGSHVLNQIERYKAFPEYRNKCFDILTDYRDLEKRVNTEIYANLQVQNDLVVRSAEYLAKSMTPESVQNLNNQTDELLKLLEEYKAKAKE